MARDDRYGINVIGYMREHEVYVKECLQGKIHCDYGELLQYHDAKIQWIQHERLVHFLVTMLTAMFMFFLFIVLLMLKQDSPVYLPVVLLTVIAVILLGAYLWHYFRLENGIQRWYKLADEIRNAALKPELAEA